MRTLAHISDLHFGRIDTAIPPALRDALLQAKPDILVVSGDLTQRARRIEFAAARAFLDSLPFPRVVVPGNHGVPLHDVMRRWLAPFEKYRHFISDDIEPFYADDEIAVQGLSTARALTWKNGRINRMQVERACANFAGLRPDVIRIVATHHPFDLPAGWQGGSLVGRAPMAIAAFAGCAVDMILSGHFHVGGAASQAGRYLPVDRAAILVQAGTAGSSRRRDQANSRNLIRTERPTIMIERQTWEPASNRFAASSRESFRLGEHGWRPLQATAHSIG